MNDIPSLPQDLERSGREESIKPEPDPRLERRRRHIAWLVGLAAVALIGSLVAIGALGHAARRSAAIDALATARSATPVVRTVKVEPVDSPRQLDLPGTMQAHDTATLYARATGYISERHVDIGSRVHKGDVLAVISAPDLDQQLAQARGQLAQMQAALAQSIADMELARVTNNRTSALVQQGWTSAQQGDTDRLTFASRAAAVGVARANLAAQQAQVERLQQLTGFEHVIAPFDGVITGRQIDVGSLVTANATTGSPLFSIARTDVLRVQIYVPQEAFFGLKDGEPAQVTVPELPGRVFEGRVARNASVLQQQTRTLLTEVDVSNADGTLTAGLYGVVHLQEPRRHPVVVVPSQALIFNKDGLNAAIYEDGVARLHRLDIEEDNGAQVEVRAGLNPGDELIVDPPIAVTDGMHVATTKNAERVAAIHPIKQ